ncbi:SET domain-containing protein [Astrocystis sublimbata]|nr:SET domain-containing protein [Astrocystis sublimbata]
MANLPERHQALLRWVEAAGGRLHPSVEIYHDPVTGGSFRVQDASSLKADDEIVSLPLSCSLSYLNAIAGHPSLSARDLPSSFHAPPQNGHLPASFLENVPPHVIGRFFLMQEYLKREASAWWPYMRTLPPPEHMTSLLPVAWPADDVEFLRGTNAYVAVQEIKALLKKEYKQAMRHLEKEEEGEYTRPLYYWAYAIFTTRSFRPSRIFPAQLSLPGNCKIDDFSVLLPLFDIGNHSPLAQIQWRTSTMKDKEGGVRVTSAMRTMQPYEAGQQVYNNYGMKTNAELLLGYGFVIPETQDFHNDYVHVKTKAGPEDLTASHIVALRPMSHPSTVVGQAKLLGPDSNSSCLPCFSHFQDSLVAALYETIARQMGDAGGVSLADVLQGRIPPQLLEEIIDALGTKCSIDLEEIEAHDPPYEAANRNQELALLYRNQCKRVLDQALATLSNVGS